MDSLFLKRIIKSLLPERLFNKYKRYQKHKYHSREFDGLPIEDIFSKIHNENFWGSDESISGSGSELTQTSQILKDLPSIINRYDIKSILDIPCGDFNWMKHFDFKELNYLGGDIVKAIVSDNNLKYRKENISFLELDLTQSPLPKSDLIICRDCLVHLSNDYIFKSINNIIRSESKYLLSTSFFDKNENYDIVTGDWRPLNLEKPPFNFPKPVDIIIEKCTEMDGFQSDKSLMLWEIDSIKKNWSF